MYTFNALLVPFLAMFVPGMREAAPELTDSPSGSAATAASAGQARLSSKDGKDKKAMGWVADMWQRGTSVLQQAPRAKRLASAAPLPPGFRCNNPHALATTPTPLPQPPRSPEPLPSP